MLSSPESAVLCLASSSPRRAQLLQQIGVAHRVVAAEIDESLRAGETAEEYVMRMAREKVAAVWADARRGRLPVLGADTSVVLDGRVLGKPDTAAEAASMLTALSDRAHVVLSAVALQSGHGANLRLCISTVRFRAISRAEIAAYWRSGESAGKAGGYAIQGLGSIFVETLTGSYSGVMGLPLFETAQLLAAAGLPMWQGSVL